VSQVNTFQVPRVAEQQETSHQEQIAKEVESIQVSATNNETKLGVLKLIHQSRRVKRELYK